LGIFNQSVQKQIQLSNKEIESLSPLNATIEVDVEGNKVFFAGDLASMSVGENLVLKRSERDIQLLIRNIGQMDSGYVYVIADSSSWLFMTSKAYYNVEGKQSFRNWTKIFHKVCDGDVGSEKNCQPEIIPTGIQNLTLFVECDFCSPQRFKKDIKICIENVSFNRICQNFTG